MKYNPTLHHRRSIRMKGYDYSRPGAYFITICTQDRLYLFGEVKNGKMILNEFGIITAEEWRRSEEIRKEITLDMFVIMPNHIHGPSHDHRQSSQHGDNPPQSYDSSIIHKIEQWGMSTVNGLKPKSVGSFVAGFKPAVSKRINEKRGTPGSPVWQRNYYDHIIRERQEFAAIRYYIIHNPVNWNKDLLY